MIADATNSFVDSPIWHLQCLLYIVHVAHHQLVTIWGKTAHFLCRVPPGLVRDSLEAIDSRFLTDGVIWMRTLAVAYKTTFTGESNPEALVRSHAVAFLGNLVRHSRGSGAFGREKERKCRLETFIRV